MLLSILFIQNSDAAPSTGTIQVAFILSEFEDQAYQSDHDQDYFEDLAFGETDSMWDYFDVVSRSQLNVEGTVYGPYTLDGDAADYGTENPDFVRDSVEIADDDIDFRDYDAVVVVHSGPGEESSGNSDDIWSVHWPSINIETDDNGHVINKISQVPEYETISGENNPLGVWCHEFGHEIGLPDLYDTDGSSAGIGDWGVMASGSWGNNGETPTYMSAWSRYALGWVEPIVITGDINNLELKPIETDGDVYLLPIPGNWSNSKQYFLLENRQKINYDAYLPGEGLLIWHIDEEIIESKWNSNSVNNDDIEVYSDSTNKNHTEVIRTLRQQQLKPEGQPNYALSDFIAPKDVGMKDYIGAFALTAGIGVDELVAKYEKENDDYSAIMVKAIADRLAEAFAECLHNYVRRHNWGYASNEKLSMEELIDEKYVGVRPAPGYPACPDHTQKEVLWRLLNVSENIGLSLTENLAMSPAASVSGWYFSHPSARYFGIGKINRDQVNDYANRKSMPLVEVEKWLASSLSYEPEE